MMKAEAVRAVGDNGSVSWSVSGIGFQLIGEDGNRGGYPLVVHLNDDTTREVIVEGPDVEIGTGPITSVKVVNGTVGDKWRLFMVPEVDDRRRQELRTTPDGYLGVRHAPAVQLFSVENNGTRGSLYSGFIYLNPGQSTRDGHHTTNANDWHGVRFEQNVTQHPYPPLWNVSRYRHLRFVAEITRNWPGTKLIPFVELHTQAVLAKTSSVAADVTPFVYTAERFTLGNLSGGLKTTFLQLGPGNNEVSTLGRAFSAAWAPYVRFGVEVSAGEGTFPRPSPESLWSENGGLLRLTALVW